MESQNHVHRITSHDSSVKIVIQDTVRQVGIITTSVGCFLVGYDKVPGARQAIIQGREVDMVELRRCLTEMADRSDILRVLGSPIISQIKVDGVYH